MSLWVIGDRFHVFLCYKDKTASFVIIMAHDMEFWALKMLILLKLHLLISNPLDFLFCIMFSSRSNVENHSCNFLKLCESTTNMMRIYVCYGHQLIEFWLRKLVLNFGGLDMPYHISKLGLIHAIELSNSVLKMVILTFSGSSHFCLPLHLPFQNVCKV